MKKIITCLLAALGLTTACRHQSAAVVSPSDAAYENAAVEAFAKLIDGDDVTLLDVRTPAEFAEGHISGAVNVDIFDENFLEQARKVLPKGKRVAVYCRSGKRSADASRRLAAEGYSVTNLVGGIIAWREASQPVTQ